MYLQYLTLAVLSAGLYILYNVGRRAKDLPPGPPTIPILGNLHQMPREKPWLQLKKWADEYGPIYSLLLGPSTTLIVLSSPETVRDLLEKRSGIYSSRPPLYIGQKISGYMRMLLTPYGKMWRLFRTLVHEHLNVQASISYVPYQDLENRMMMLGFLENPEKWNAHVRRYTNALTTQMVFGFRAVSNEDKDMNTIFECVEDWSTTTNSPAAQMMDVFPVLQKLPSWLLSIKRKAERLHEKELKLNLKHWNNAKKAALNGTAKPCFSADLALAQKQVDISNNQASYLTGTLNEAGSDTTWATLIGFIQAMILYPDVARIAQEEIDRVCGDRLPAMEDEPKMQYIRGCVKESLRWMSIAPLGIPRSVIQEDFYNGYRIPKGATVLMNVWAIHYDEKNYANARAFNPARYANDFSNAFESSRSANFAERDHYTFGAGRRLCQGIHIAERSLFLAISRFLWAFDFSCKKDAQGNDIVPDPGDLITGLVVRPNDFPVEIKPRSEKKAKQVRREWEIVEGKLDEKGQWKNVPEGMFSKKYVPLVS